MAGAGVTPEEAGEAFDRAARTPMGPSPAQVDAVLWAITETEGGILDLLLYSLQNLCDAGDDETAPGYGAAVAGLASRLPSPFDRAVLAVVDVELAWLDACTDRWEQAALRVRRAGPGADELPYYRGRRERMLAILAEHDGRDADAAAHLRTAEDAFVGDGRWDDAGDAAATRAELCTRPVDDRLRDLRDAADHLAVAERIDAEDRAERTAARHRWVERAVGLAARAIQALEPGQKARAVALATAAREIALAHGEARLAAEIGVLGSAHAIHVDEPWTQTQHRVDGLRAELTALSEHPDGTRLQLGLLDFQEGTAARFQHRLDLAERLLARALEVFRAEGMTDAMSTCEEQLGLVLLATGGPAVGWRGQPAPGAPDRAGAEDMLAAFDDVRADRDHDARSRMAAAAGRWRAAGHPIHALVCEVLAGMLALDVGNTASARAAADAARRGFDRDRSAAIRNGTASAEGRLVREARCLADLLNAELAGLDGDAIEHIRGLERAEQGMLAAGSSISAAGIALKRAALLLVARRAAEALDVVLPAMLALDAARAALPDAARRRSWAALVAIGFHTAFYSAVLAGRPVVVAELLEVARGNGMPLPRAADDRSDAMSALADLLTPGAGAPQPQPTLPGASAVAGAGRTALGVPARLITPWGTVALAAYLERAQRYRDPVRAEATVQWEVVPA